MITTIVEAATNFCSHQLRQQCHIADQDCSDKLLTASIEITANEQINTIYIAIETVLLQDLCILFLDEEKSTQEVLIDMLLEATNMIAGSAKTLLHERNETRQYAISTPTFLQNSQFDYQCDQKICLATDFSYILIAYKEQK